MGGLCGVVLSDFVCLLVNENSYCQEEAFQHANPAQKKAVSQGYETGPRAIPSRGIMLKIRVVPS